MAVGVGIGNGIESDVELGLFHVQNLATPFERLVHVAKHLLANSHVARGVVEVGQSLEAVLHDLGDRFIDAGNRLECIGCFGIRGVLKLLRVDTRKGSKLALLDISHDLTIDLLGLVRR